MACSKLFSGDLPELINEIIKYFHYDRKTLHSCILVNRLWCRLTIPLLWEDPFSTISPKSYNFIEIYLYKLNDEDKKKLKNYGINSELFPSNTLFNYPSFIQHLDTCKIDDSIDKWVESPHSNYFKKKPNSSIKRASSFKKLIYKSLLQIFIENEVNLYKFEISMFKFFNKAFELILQHPNFVYNIKNLSLNTMDMTENFLKYLYSNCSSISSLYLLFRSYKNDYLLSKNILSEIIESQESLKKILFGYNCTPLYHLLLSLKNSNCSNTLNTIIFYYVNFKNITILSEVFNQLNVLESIHIVWCYSLDSKFIQQINNITKPFKLKSLFPAEMSQIDSYKLLIQKSGNYLENLGIFGFSNGSQLLEQLLDSVRKYCSKIKFLHLANMLIDQNINLTSLIDNIKRNLNYLYIRNLTHKFNSVILQNLGQVLPYKLEYLSLELLAIDTSDLEVFLKNSQNTFIKKLLIKNMGKGESQDIFPYIEEYIVKKKKVKYLAIFETFYKKSEDLFSMKEKVKEFESNNIQVLSYGDLFIDIYDFMKEA
jgi:hypothetical protein